MSTGGFSATSGGGAAAADQNRWTTGVPLGGREWELDGAHEIREISAVDEDADDLGVELSGTLDAQIEPVHLMLLMFDALTFSCKRSN